MTIPRTVESFQGLCWTEPEEVEALIACLPDDPVKVHQMVELGTASGVTAALISRARPNVRILCVDDFRPSPEGCRVEQFADRDENRAQHWQANRQPNMHFIGCLTSTFPFKVPKRWLRCGFDLAFVDAGHRFQEVLDDLQTIGPFMTVGGTIAVHDFHSREWPEVAPAVHAFCLKHGRQLERCVGLTAFLKRVSG